VCLQLSLRLAQGPALHTSFFAWSACLNVAVNLPRCRRDSNGYEEHAPHRGRMAAVLYTDRILGVEVESKPLRADRALCIAMF